MHQVGTSSLLIYMMHGHTYIKFGIKYLHIRVPWIICSRACIFGDKDCKVCTQQTSPRLSLLSEFRTVSVHTWKCNLIYTHNNYTYLSVPVFTKLKFSTTLCANSKGVPREAEVAQGVPGRLRPRIFVTFRHYKGSGSSVRRTGRLYSRRNPWYSLSEAESTSGHMVLSGVPRKRIPSDITGNRSRDRPTSSAAP